MTDDEVLRAAKNALRMVCVSLPHLSGLAHLSHLEIDGRVPSAGIFASGRMLVNAAWFGELTFPDQVFVMAHELLHLALRTHDRAAGTDPRRFNVAHDYIINDMLVEALGRDAVPAGGLAWAGARSLSAEQILQQMYWPLSLTPEYWTAASGRKTALGDALSKAGLPAITPDPVLEDEGVDALSDELERRWFPGLDRNEQRRVRMKVEAAAIKSESLAALGAAMNRIEGTGGAGSAMLGEQAIEALHTLYRPPWELALQQWMETVAPAGRTYARPSRRGADRNDVALAGRKREGWTLHILLDTSGSMSGEFSRILGVIGSFCEGANVGQAHILQCDQEVTRDEYLSPEELASFTIAGFGGSDMSPGLHRLAEDPEVEVVMVLTDGEINYPWEPMPYHVLWTLTCENARFDPPYGQVLRASLG